VWNPGGLPEDLTAEQLRKPHASIPRNRLICEPLFLAHYIERAGTGTLDMIRLCAKAGLPEPEFRNEGERFITIIWRDWITETLLEKLELTEQQQKVVLFLKKNKRINNKTYQTVFHVSKSTATRHLEDLEQKGLLQKVGSTGKGTHYILDTKGSRRAQRTH
jgi:predicted HTH transcriptional regulator